MIKTNLLRYKVNLKSLWHAISPNSSPYELKGSQRCLCGQMFHKNEQTPIRYKYRRFYSSQSDQHRQKVVIETSTPKIVIDKDQGDVSQEQKNVDGGLLEFWKEKVVPYAKLARWDRPIGLLPETIEIDNTAALTTPNSTVQNLLLSSSEDHVASDFAETTLETAGLFLLGAGLMRGAGCTINDLWDKDVDAQVERTKDRPLVSGAISDKQAVAFLAAQLSLALGVLLQLNCYSIVLGASSMLLVVTYPLMKRITNYPQIFLGATFNWGALLGYSAIHGGIQTAVCLPLYAGALAWTVVYDTIYAHQDKEDDARIGMKSTALTFGEHTKPALVVALTASVASLGTAGAAAGLELPYYAALALYSLHAGRQIYTLNLDNPNDCAKKFKSNSMVGLIILMGILGGGYRQYIENREKNRGKENVAVTKSCLFS